MRNLILLPHKELFQPVKGLELALLSHLFQKPGEQLLGEVLGQVSGMALPADEGVERVPVGAAQLGQRRLRGGRVALPGRKDHAPVGGRKGSWSTRQRGNWLVGEGHALSL